MIPMQYRQYEAKSRLVARVRTISAMLKAATDELIQAAHDEEVLYDAGYTDDVGDPINRVASGFAKHSHQARHEVESCLLVLELWAPHA